MKQAHLKRGYYASDVTLGMLYVDGADLPPIYTLEEPWKDNQRKISCIPPGKYVCRPHEGIKFKSVWQLQDVPGRDAILIHAGNTTMDVEGCILVGLEHGILDGREAVLKSRQALGLLRDAIGTGNSFEITIS